MIYTDGKPTIAMKETDELITDELMSFVAKEAELNPDITLGEMQEKLVEAGFLPKEYK